MSYIEDGVLLYIILYMTIQCSIQTFFGHTDFLKLRIGQFSDTPNLPKVVAAGPKIFHVQCIWGRIFVSIEKIYVFRLNDFVSYSFYLK